MSGLLPYLHDELFTFMTLGALKSPPCKLSGHDREMAWDIKAAKGQVGASTTKNGDPIGKFEAIYFLTDQEDFDLWEDFQRLLESMINGPKPQALPVYHPDLARNHFTEVTVALIGGMVHDGKGGASVKVRFIEYKPPKPKPAAKPAAKPGGAGRPGGAGAAGPAARPDPNAAAKRELSELLATARRP